MDVVYILGKGSLAGDLELKYSIRSLVANMADLGAIYVVGEEPKTAPLAKHIPADDKYPKKWQNALYKSLLACEDSQITDEFLLMNDDFFVTEPFLGSEYPFYRAKNGDGGPNGMYDFQIHCPIRLNKEWYMQMPLNVEMSGDFSPRSFYANFYRAPSQPIDDCIVRVGAGLKSYDQQIGKNGFFSIGNGAMQAPDFLEWLKNKYPNPSSTE